MDDIIRTARLDRFDDTAGADTKLLRYQRRVRTRRISVVNQRFDAWPDRHVTSVANDWRLH